MTADPEVSKIGNVTRAPELKTGKSGIDWCKFGIAVTPYVAAGEPEQETQYYDVVCFASLAEHVCETLQKGDRVVVIGKGKRSTWTGRDGQERTTKEIMADGVGPDLRWLSVQLPRDERRAGAAPGPEPYEDEEPF